jgi:hypothetical protein
VIREFTNVRRRRQDDGYQYNDINPITKKKRIIKSLVGVLDAVHALLTTAKYVYFHVLYSTLAFQAVAGNFSSVDQHCSGS